MKHVKTISASPAAAVQVPIIGTIDIKGSILAFAGELASAFAAITPPVTKNNVG